MEELFCDYYDKWVDLYKEGAVRPVTLKKYRMTAKWIRKLMPDVTIKNLDRQKYQAMINKYAETHEKVTVKDFNTQVRACIGELVEERALERDPSKRIVIKGKSQTKKKNKYLDQFQLHQLLEVLDLSKPRSIEWQILIAAKTGLRYSELLGLTPEDIDMKSQSIRVNKTWDYKNGTGFVETKNKSSVRTVKIDWKLLADIGGMIRDIPADKPIFVQDTKKDL